MTGSFARTTKRLGLGLHAAPGAILAAGRVGWHFVIDKAHLAFVCDQSDSAMPLIFLQEVAEPDDIRTIARVDFDSACSLRVMNRSVARG